MRRAAEVCKGLQGRMGALLVHQGIVFLTSHERTTMAYQYGLCIVLCDLFMTSYLPPISKSDASLCRP